MPITLSHCLLLSSFLEELRTLAGTSFQESHILAQGNLCLTYEAPAGTVQFALELQHVGCLHPSKSPDLPSVLTSFLSSLPVAVLCLRTGPLHLIEYDSAESGSSAVTF